MTQLTPRQVLAGLFIICGVALGYSVATSLFRAQAQVNPGEVAPPPPTEGLPPDNFPPVDMVPGAGAPQFDANGLPLDVGGAGSIQTPLEPSLKVVNPEGFIYNPEGLRDPFFPVRKGGPRMVEQPQADIREQAEVEYDPREPLQADRLMDYRLVGVLWDVRDPRALIQTPQGRVVTIKKKHRLGREGAVVVAIRESEIVVAEPNPDGTYSNATTRVILMKR